MLIARVGDGSLDGLRAAGIFISLHADARSKLLLRIEGKCQIAVGIVGGQGILQHGIGNRQPLGSALHAADGINHHFFVGRRFVGRRKIVRIWFVITISHFPSTNIFFTIYVVYFSRFQVFNCQADFKSVLYTRLVDESKLYSVTIYIRFKELQTLSGLGCAAIFGIDDSILKSGKFRR